MEGRRIAKIKQVQISEGGSKVWSFCDNAVIGRPQTIEQVSVWLQLFSTQNSFNNLILR